MKRTTDAPERYERPSTARFAPSPWQKGTVRNNLVNVDWLASIHIESRNLSPECVRLTDEHGYPFA